MLITCPECGLQVSDHAEACPHCGYPIKPKTKRKPKHVRLPNGFGQISEIKNRNLRNPWRAMVTVGKDSNGRPICKVLRPQGYFKTYNEAYMALVEYNKNPYDLDDDMTVKELYEKWSPDYFSKLNASTIRGLESCWGYCAAVYEMRVKELRARHIKGCMDDGTIKVGDTIRTTTPNIKQRIKSLFNNMLDYAVEYEIVDKNYARTFNVDSSIKKEKDANTKAHMTFSNQEMEILWSNVGKYKYADYIIVQCYSGWRPQELGLITIDNVNINDWYFVGGLKTDAGTDRLVPIHTKIRDIVKRYYDEAVSNGWEYLFPVDNGSLMNYGKYKLRFETAIKRLELNLAHKPHDPRKQFVTMAKNANVDEYAIKYLVGHSIQDITEKVYTERNIDWLREEIEKI